MQKRPPSASGPADVVNEDISLKAICLTERHIRTSSAAAAAQGGGEATVPPQLASSGGRTPHMRMAATILEAYEFKLQSVHVSARPLNPFPQ